MSYLLIQLNSCRLFYIAPSSWTPAGMGRMGHLLPSGNVVKCFCALVLIAKRSVDELFMHYFHNLSSAYGASAPRRPLGLHPWTPLGTFVPRPLICSPLENILRAPMPPPHKTGEHPPAKFLVASHYRASRNSTK